MFEQFLGEPIHGEYHSSDASAGAQIPIYNQGSKTARTLQPWEYIEIHEVSVITVAGGDTEVYLAPTSTPVAGKIVKRGTFAANSGLEVSRTLTTGEIGDLPWVKSPAGAIDVEFTGCIRVAGSLDTRGRFNASLVPGQ